MGFRIQLEDENGDIEDSVQDPSGLLYDALPTEVDSSYPYLSYIDRYGDTVFNRQQMQPFLREWDQLTKKNSDIRLRRLMNDLRRLAEKCENGLHAYLRFVGE